MTSNLTPNGFANDKRHGNVNRRGSNLMEIEGFKGEEKVRVKTDTANYKDFKPKRPVCNRIADTFAVGSEEPKKAVRRNDGTTAKEEELPWNGQKEKKIVSAKEEFKKNRDGMSFMIEGDVDYTPESGSLVDFKPARPVINRIPDSGIDAGGKHGKQY